MSDISARTCFASDVYRHLHLAMTVIFILPQRQMRFCVNEEVFLNDDTGHGVDWEADRVSARSHYDLHRLLREGVRQIDAHASA